MNKQMVFIEVEGKEIHVGDLLNNDGNVLFQYTREYLDWNNAKTISVSLPLQEEPFSNELTKAFFEGLLPEGFTRKTVAGWLHINDEDYISMLGILWQECLGAIRILENDNIPCKASYEKLTLKQVKELARNGVQKSAEFVAKSHLSLTGASGKVGLYYDSGKWLLPKDAAPSTHIVKQSHVRLDSIVLNEQLSLLTAKNMGFKVAESFIINTGKGNDEEVLFASKRYDRLICENSEIIDGVRKPQRLHQEDFAQAMGIKATDKYEKKDEHYLPKMFEILKKHSSNPIEDSMRLWDMVILNFLIGNTDNHIKNHSLLYSSNLQSLRLAPVYDIVSTCVYESSTRNMAFKIGNKYSIDEIKRNDFEEAAKQCGLGVKPALRRFDELTDSFENSLAEATDQLISEGMDNAKSIKNRILENGGYAKI